MVDVLIRRDGVNPAVFGDTHPIRIGQSGLAGTVLFYTYDTLQPGYDPPFRYLLGNEEPAAVYRAFSHCYSHHILSISLDEIFSHLAVAQVIEKGAPRDEAVYGGVNNGIEDKLVEALLLRKRHESECRVCTGPNEPWRGVLRRRAAIHLTQQRKKSGKDADVPANQNKKLRPV